MRFRPKTIATIGVLAALWVATPFFIRHSNQEQAANFQTHVEAIRELPKEYVTVGDPENTGYEMEYGSVYAITGRPFHSRLVKAYNLVLMCDNPAFFTGFDRAACDGSDRDYEFPIQRSSGTMQIPNRGMFKEYACERDLYYDDSECEALR